MNAGLIFIWPFLLWLPLWLLFGFVRHSKPQGLPRMGAAGSFFFKLKRTGIKREKNEERAKMKIAL